MRLYMTKKKSDELKALLNETDQLVEFAQTAEEKEELSLRITRISALLLSPLLPHGGLRISLMVGLITGGILGCVHWSWWFAFAGPAAAMFSPWIVGETALLAGCFARWISTERLRS